LISSIPKKQNRFGIKFYMICYSEEYTYIMSVY
jgi:hypothetical protein